MSASWCLTDDWCATFPNRDTLLQLAAKVLPIWVCGAVVGLLMPRPKPGASGKWALLQAAFLRPNKWALAWHSLVIVREVWYHWTCPGTFRRLAHSVANLARGKAWKFDFPNQDGSDGAVAASAGTPCAAVGSIQAPRNTWYVTEKDLAFFQYHAESGGPAPGASSWEIMMEREIPFIIKYTAWRRTLANGKTEYKSVTHCPDATAEEFMDMYLDDDNRPNWDTMIIQHSVLEQGDLSSRQQVVRWIRRFPFSFISDREYVIAKRVFKQAGALYGLTKAVEHPQAPPPSEVVKMDVFYSMWRSRTVPCPWGTNNPACETLLLHHEQFKIPENLARFAVKHGMWGFVRKLSSETPKFIEQRRKRCPSDQDDPQAFGAAFLTAPREPPAVAAKPPKKSMNRVATTASCLSSLTASPTSPFELHLHEAHSLPNLLGLGTTTTAHLLSPCSAALANLDLAASTPAALLSPCPDATTSALPGYQLLSRCRTGPHRTRSSTTTTTSSKVRSLAAFAIASGLAMLMRRSASSERLGLANSSRSRSLGGSGAVGVGAQAGGQSPFVSRAGGGLRAQPRQRAPQGRSSDAGNNASGCCLPE
ncbi:hypothetical protein V8C86DRAFT_2710480 [Haematococcus lacustris]